MSGANASAIARSKLKLDTLVRETKNAATFILALFITPVTAHCLTDYCRHHVGEAALVEQQRSDMEIVGSAAGNWANPENARTG